MPAGAPAGLTVRLCAAAELAAALQLMQARLHPDLAEVCSVCAVLRCEVKGTPELERTCVTCVM